MSAALTHRGPDDEGFHISEGAALGMRRLSIIDIDGGRQPIASESGRIWLICNGEIYNYRELRKSLEHKGHRFSTASDVEVILHAYEEYGSGFIDFINGMFAFALWDGERRQLILARDRVGIKPLYYSVGKDAVIFASELRAILRHPDISPDLDFVAFRQYLTFEYVPSPRSIIRNVKKLPPGHILVYSAHGGVQLKKYWDVSFERSESRPPLNMKEVRDQFLETLGASVDRELMSDVPLGVFLSGGIDSSAVAAMAARRSGARIKTFSLKFDDPSFDESRYAELAADRLGTEHLSKTLTAGEIISIIQELPKLLDEPLGDSSFVPTLALSRFAREHVKVVLGGDGGDELFAGYPTFQAHKFVEIYERCIPFYLRANLIPALISKLPVSLNNISWDYKLRRFLKGRGVPLAVRHHLWLGSFGEEDGSGLLHPDLNFGESDTYAVLSDHLKNCDATNPYNKLLYLDMKMYLEGDILAKVDRASMAHSLEVRVPLLNTKLLTYVLSLPISFKFRGFSGKYLLKKSMRGILPAPIIKRAKKGFNFPVAKLLRNELMPMLRDYLQDGLLAKQGYFNRAYVNRLIDDHSALRTDNRKQLWTLLAFQLWWSGLSNVRSG